MMRLLPSEAQFDIAYYTANGQLEDRPALGLYTRILRRAIGPGPVLDHGCGTGHLVRRLAQRGPAAGFEVSPAAASLAARVCPDARIFTESDHIPSSAFDGLASIHVIEHLSDQQLESVLGTWKRVLRPGAHVLVVTPDLGGRAHRLTGDSWAGFDDPTHINLKGHAAWRELFTDHGFHVRREASDGLWNPPYRRLPRLLDAAVHSGPALAQFASGAMILPPGSGESAMFLLRTPS